MWQNKPVRVARRPFVTKTIVSNFSKTAAKKQLFFIAIIYRVKFGSMSVCYRGPLNSWILHTFLHSVNESEKSTTHWVNFLCWVLVKVIRMKITNDFDWPVQQMTLNDKKRMRIWCNRRMTSPEGSGAAIGW